MSGWFSRWIKRPKADAIFRTPQAANEELRDLLSKDHYYGWSDHVEKLLDEGADPNVTDSHGCPALCIVAQYGYPRTVGHLLALGADINARRVDGDTPLKIATRFGREAMVDRFLSDQGLKMEDAVDALQVAFQHPHVAVLIRLLTFLDILKSERYRYLSAVQVGTIFAVTVEESDYSKSILRVIEDFISATLKWPIARDGEVRHRWDHHIQDRSYICTIGGKGDQAAVIGHLIIHAYDSDYGMGSETSSCAGVVWVYLNDQHRREAAAHLLQLVRAIAEKTK